MAIDPKKGGKCWSCKHCEDVGFESEYDAVYVRKCTKSGHDYIDKCTNYCSSYIWDGKDPEFNYTSSSSSSSSTSYSSSSSGDENKPAQSTESVATNQKTAICNAKHALNMRSGPGEEHEKVGSIPRGETVIIEKEENGWAYVDYNGVKGWCAMNYLEINE